MMSEMFVLWWKESLSNRRKWANVSGKKSTKPLTKMKSAHFGYCWTTIWTWFKRIRAFVIQQNNFPLFILNIFCQKMSLSTISHILSISWYFPYLINAIAQSSQPYKYHCWFPRGLYNVSTVYNNTYSQFCIVQSSCLLVTKKSNN